MNKKNFIKFFLFFCSFLHISLNKEVNNEIREELTSLDDTTFSEYKKICRETIFYDHQKCFAMSKEYEKNITKSLLNNYQKINEEMKVKVSYIYYNLGNIYYHGFISKEPNLNMGLAYFLISSYFGSPHSKYKLAIILSNGIFEQIYKDKGFEKLLSNFELLKLIAQTEYYKKNFVTLFDEYNKEEKNINDNTDEPKIRNRIEDFKNSLVISFLYSSALQNYPPAKKVLANKLNKGYGVPFSCKSASNYYIELARDTIKEMTELNTKLYFNYIKIDKYEYVGSKFNEDNTKDESQIIDLYWSQITGKKEENNLKIIKELAKIYYYGSSGVTQNFETSFSLFKKAQELNDTDSLFYLGEHYLNGFGTEINYTKAHEYFEESIKYNTSENAKSWNSLGYLYYYGLGVEKDIKKAFDYFKIGVTYKDSSALFDAAYLLIQNYKGDENLITKDYVKAHGYAQGLAAKDYSFGTYLYAMMNQYSIGSSIKSCDINIKFFISVCEKNLYTKYLYDLAFKYYIKKMYRQAFLIYLELAEGGSEPAEINAALLLDNYPIFKDKDFQKYLTYKYYYMTHLAGNALASLKLGDFFQEGFGELNKDMETAKQYYKDAKGAEIMADTFKLSHADFNLGMIHLFNGNSTNITNDIYQSDLYFNSSETLESLTHYPIKIAKFYYKYFYSNNNYSKFDLVKKIFFDNTIGGLFQKSFYLSWQFGSILITIILYALFYLSLLYQNE